MTSGPIRASTMPAAAAGFVAAGAVTLLLALVPDLRRGGPPSPLGLWMIGAIGIALLVGGTAMPGPRHAPSRWRRPVAAGSLAAVLGIAATGIIASVALGTPEPLRPFGIPEEMPTLEAPAEMSGALAGEFGGIDLAGSGACTPNPDGSVAYHQTLEAEPFVNVELIVGADGIVRNLQIVVAVPEGEFLFLSGKGWDAGPPWVTPDGAPTAHVGAATLSGIVNSAGDQGGAPSVASGRISWTCLG